MWANPKIALMMHTESVVGEEGDAWKAKLYLDMKYDRLTDMCFRISSDAAILHKDSNVSYTPIVLRMMNLPYHLRHRASALFLWAHLPKKFEVHDAIRYLLETEIDLFRDGFDVYDAHTKTHRRMRVRITGIVEDSVGLPGPTGCFSCSASIGACPFCDLRGFPMQIPGEEKRKGRVMCKYPGAVRYLAIGHPLRRKWKQVFGKVDSTNAVAVMGDEWVDERTTEEVLKEASACMSGLKAEKDCFWKRTSPFNEVLDEAIPHEAPFDIVRMAIPDPAHSISNIIKDLFYFMCHDFDDSKRKFEREVFGREWPRKVPWKVSANRRRAIDKMIEGKIPLRVPTSWVNPAACMYSTLENSGGRTFTGGKTMKMSQRLWFCSDAGRYIISLTDCEDDMKKLFCRLLKVCEKLLGKLQDKSLEDEVRNNSYLQCLFNTYNVYQSI